MFSIGLNPYGLSYTVGLQAIGTARANPRPLGLDGFIALVRARGLSVIELDWRWLLSLPKADLARVRDDLSGLTTIFSYWLAHRSGETLIEAIGAAEAVGASIFRMHLTPVLEGARAREGARWPALVAHARGVLERDAARVRDAGLTLAIENHQDLGSEELIAIAAGLDAGLVLDTGNPYSVGEDPVAFVQRAAPYIRHVHLKDYRAQFTDEGFRLVRCAIGDGCVPFDRIAEVLHAASNRLTASLEPGALESRHIRLFTRDWWEGYPPRDARELAAMLARLRLHALHDADDCRTPWETGASHAEIVAYEQTQLERSLANVRQWGWM